MSIRVAGPVDLDLALASDPAALEELAPEWQALWRRAGGRFGASPLACQLAWRHVEAADGARLALVTGRRAGELAFVLPMVVQWRRPLRVLRPLGPGAADYPGILLDPDCDAVPALAQVWRHLTRCCGADVVLLPRLAVGSGLHAVAARQPAARLTGSDVLAVASLPPQQTFEQYCAGLGRLSHMRPGGLRRRLARAGALDVAVLEPDDPALIALVDWMLQRKREWAQRAGKDGPWLAHNGYRDFIVAALAARDGAAPARMLAVRLDGAPVVVTVMGLGTCQAEGLVNGFDPAFGRFSPGLIAVEACVEWVFDQGLSLDFGVGAEEYKQYWSRGQFSELQSLQLPLSVRGRLAMGARGAARRATSLLARS